MITINQYKDRGRCFVASVPIKAGTVIVRELPIIQTVNYMDPLQNAFCHQCLTYHHQHQQHSSPLLHCSKCKLVWYCNRDCASKDADQHELECPSYSRLHSTNLFDNDCKTMMKMLIKIIVYNHLKQQQQQQQQQGVESTTTTTTTSIDSFNIKTILELEGNRSQFPTQRLLGLSKIAKFIEKGLISTKKELMNGFDQQKLINIMCILECNTHELAFTIPTIKEKYSSSSSLSTQLESMSIQETTTTTTTTSTVKQVQKEEIKITYNYKSIGSGLYDQCSYFNHSCQPNIFKVNQTPGGELVMVALRDIEQGEELFYNYIQISMSGEARIKKLKESYFFNCQCPGCKNAPSHKQFLDKYLCKVKQCNGVITPLSNLCNICKPYLIDNDNKES
ncbi:hypothetical protein DFA_05619 [Cavenderia fasciculata]|uniref:SET domain-containing protein n=1 Tax=Cavenderia fasciculata TaxID=261658 RepID=F4PLR4_CACFS|nr:uncharacterized protein DFA_05619 [Cavenderia fasciculata]EGG23486.1 hypothetical protein DFA_05619 [Cavenderia fasciculata]|eukprot:XP_004361337.1 hypothetical protein DFA_05619 [Cavenderia fasciculata]